MKASAIATTTKRELLAELKLEKEMKICLLGSVIQPSPVAAIQQRYHYLPPIPIRPLCLSPLFLTPTNSIISTTASVLQRDLEVGVTSPDSDDAVSSQNENPTIELETTRQTNEEAAPLVTNGVPEEKGTGLKKKKEQEDNDLDYRYKLRNGREVFAEKAYLVGVERKSDAQDSFGIEESLSELEQLADTAGLLVVGTTYQKLTSPNPRTYIGSGKVSEIKSAIHALDVETVIFDDELSAGQLRNLEKNFGGDVRVCDRTALILDIFNQRAATHEASLQVSLAQMEYQLPRLTKMWTHLERQAGGKVKGMGEKQIEVDKRILRNQIGILKKELESVRKHRKQYRNRRFSVPVPVVSLVGYTNAGKSTLLNQLTGADVLAEDKLFATLDPTTRRVQMKNGKEFLLTDTVGFIQKLPTTLVAAFRATLEEISESSLLVHVVDISHPLAEQQINAVDKVLSELDVSSIPRLMVWNKVDNVSDPHEIRLEAEKREDVVCISALSGEGLTEFCNAVQDKLKDSMVWVEALLPFENGDLLSTIHQVGMVEKTEYTEQGTYIKAHVPLRFARLLTPMRQLCVSRP
ncbi:Small GTP-binding protein domain [Sesbania bispinosa]|nr:Small GTP-binding protein domain [Sesbania bispinosa]